MKSKKLYFLGKMGAHQNDGWNQMNTKSKCKMDYYLLYGNNSSLTDIFQINLNKFFTATQTIV